MTTLARYGGQSSGVRIAALTGAAILAVYASTLKTMFQVWTNDEDMAHGVLVPLVILWFLYRERARLRALPVTPTAWGWVVLTIGAALQLASVRGAGVFIGSAAFVITIAGAVLCLGGFQCMRALAFPFVLSLFMLPKLAYFYNEVTLPLQLLASRMAAAMLTSVGFNVIRAGNLLTVSGHQVSVEAACNGLRYLFPLAFVAIVFAYLTGSKSWIRAALVAVAVPLAIVANAVRVAVSAASPRFAEGDWHTFAGLVVFALALPAIPLMHGFFRSLDRRLHA